MGANAGRLNVDLAGGAWCPRSQVSGLQDSPEWIQVCPVHSSTCVLLCIVIPQVDLESEHIITGVITQGRFAHGLGQVTTSCHPHCHPKVAGPPATPSRHP